MCALVILLAQMRMPVPSQPLRGRWEPKRRAWLDPQRWVGGVSPARGQIRQECVHGGVEEWLCRVSGLQCDHKRGHFNRVYPAQLRGPSVRRTTRQVAHIKRDTWRIYNGRRDTWRTERRPTRHVADAKELQAERHVAVHVATLRTVCHVPRCARSSTCHAVHRLPASRGSGRGRPDAPPAHVCVEP